MKWELETERSEDQKKGRRVNHPGTKATFR